MRRLVWPRLLYWTALAVTASFLLYSITTTTPEDPSRARANAQSGAALLASIGVLGLVVGKAWMDSVVAARSRATCPACKTLAPATAAHCSACGAPLRTTREMLEVLQASPASEPVELRNAA